MLNWGESFDVAAEFAGLMSRLNEGQRRQQFQVLQAKLRKAVGQPERLGTRAI
jgi:hypothetical protein